MSETLEIINAVKDFISSGDPDAAAIADMRKLLGKEYAVDSNRAPTGIIGASLRICLL